MATEEGEGFEDGFGEAEEVNENGVVKGLAGGIAVGLVGGEEFVVAEVGEDAVGPFDLVRCQLADVECQQRWELADRESCPALLLASAHPPKTDQPES